MTHTVTFDDTLAGLPVCIEAEVTPGEPPVYTPFSRFPEPGCGPSARIEAAWIVTEVEMPGGCKRRIAQDLELARRGGDLIGVLDRWEERAIAEYEGGCGDVLGWPRAVEAAE